MALLPVQTNFNIDLQFETAPFHLRFLAWLIDIVILFLYMWFITHFLFTSFDIEDLSNMGLMDLFLIIPVLMYHLICELTLSGQSIGKKILRIKVVSLTGKNATVSQYILRWLLRFLDAGFLYCILFFASGELFLGLLTLISSFTSFILFLTSKYNQRLGDVMAGTSVILKQPAYNLSETIFKNIDVKAYTVTFPEVMKLSDRDINIINNILVNRNRSKSNIKYIEQVAEKIKTALTISSNLYNEDFLETLLNDYNYLSRK
jgi:uncharacterized RDD family membrane protein YckC